MMDKQTSLIYQQTRIIAKLEQENYVLRQQIEKMKNCGNCKNLHKLCFGCEDENGKFLKWELRTNE